MLLATKPWRRNSGDSRDMIGVTSESFSTMLSPLATYEVSARYIAAEFDFRTSVEVIRMLLLTG